VVRFMGVGPRWQLNRESGQTGIFLYLQSQGIRGLLVHMLTNSLSVRYRIPTAVTLIQLEKVSDKLCQFQMRHRSQVCVCMNDKFEF